ncbi:RES domain-containing protein [Arthrobacter sp. Soil764]|uniref:RES domain-containing protein n=1 Tax=Arthrobacter sp. Soil764 TaxID=1736403 RepID=UPI000A89EF62|nr:RES domain-containing protein [Arthrobacter sp. Soil764]
MTRADSALPEPPADLTGFPSQRIEPDRKLWRAVQAPNPDRWGAWWFSSNGGRFDLPNPLGTCYLATDVKAAIRERLGRVFRIGSLLPESLMHAMELAEVQLPHPVEVADTGHESAADWGAIRELGSVTGSYAKTVRWAQAFQQASFGGVLYEPRFSSRAEASAVGVFDAAGAKPWPEGARLSGQEAFTLTGLDKFVAVIPSSKAAKIIAPPPPVRR